MLTAASQTEDAIIVKQTQQPVTAEREATGDWTATRFLRVFVVSAGDSSDVSGIEEDLIPQLAGYVGLIAGSAP